MISLLVHTNNLKVKSQVLKIYSSMKMMNEILSSKNVYDIQF